MSSNITTKIVEGEFTFEELTDSTQDWDLKYLILKGSEIDVKDKNQNTPLLLAADGGRASAVKLLLEKGADVSFA